MKKRRNHMPTDQELIKNSSLLPPDCLSGNRVLCVFSFWNEYVYQSGMGEMERKIHKFLILQSLTQTSG